jgi:hypothetical protein
VFSGLHQAGCDPLTVMTPAVLYCMDEKLAVTEIAKQATGSSPQQLAVLLSASCKPQRTFRR